MKSVTVYEENGNDALLEEFVIAHRPLVKKIALYIKRRLPSHIELDDLLQSGLIGLLEAKKTYRPDGGASFETYATIRIKGCIIDSLRKTSVITRDILKNIKKMSEAISKLEQRNQKNATADEIAAELNITLEEYHQIAQEINFCNVLNIDNVDPNSTALGLDSLNPELMNQREEIKKNLQEVIKNIPEREQMILSLYYVEEFTFAEIGEILDLTEARICQLHVQAISRIRKKMEIQ